MSKCLNKVKSQIKFFSFQLIFLVLPSHAIWIFVPLSMMLLSQESGWRSSPRPSSSSNPIFLTHLQILEEWGNSDIFDAYQLSTTSTSEATTTTLTHINFQLHQGAAGWWWTKEGPWRQRSRSTWRPKVDGSTGVRLSLIHIWRCRRLLTCRSRWSPYH